MMTVEPKHKMIRFLLGEMPAEERAGFEDEFIKDTEVFQRLVELENDLIDLYAMGALSRSERKRFEHSFLADPERRKRLSFARALVVHASETASASTERLKTGIRRRWFQPISPVLLPIAGILLLFMLTGMSWLLAVNHQLRTELQASQKQQAEALKTVVNLQKQVEVLTQDVDARNRSDGQAAQGTPSDRNLLSFALKDDSWRSSGVIPRLIVPSTTSAVALHLIFPADTFSSYELFIETASGTPIWHKGKVQGERAGAGSKEVVVRLPAHLLKDGDYVARITAGSSRGLEDVAGYSFSVVKR